LRIIGGDWRSRKISFAHNPAIRPSPDRIRETLFNWLQYSIPGARCLELYAGSGILSLEALSRHASHITIVDRAADVIAAIKTNLTLLKAEPGQYECIQASALTWLSSQENTWDLIFLDPPFKSQELESLLPIIATNKLLKPDGYVYLETPKAIEQQDLPEGWHIHRNKKAASVHYCLCQLEIST